MPQTINTNVASLNAQRNLNSSQSDANTALQRLSSGLRINSAKDDAAGLSISNRLTAQINGINQAIRNAGDGISVGQVAEGALSETGNILQRMRELAVQSANASNSGSDRAALQSEVSQLSAEIDRIANNTAFGDQKLLNGNFANQQFQVGANVGETISVSVASAQAADLGQLNSLTFGANAAASSLVFETGAVSTVATSANNESFIEAQTLTFQTGPASDLTSYTVSVADNASAATIASGITANVANVSATAQTVVRVEVGATTSNAAAGDTVDIDVNGVTLSGLDYSSVANFTAALETAIEGNSALSGLSATSTATYVEIVDAAGNDIEIGLSGYTDAAFATGLEVDLDLTAYTDTAANTGVAISSTGTGTLAESATGAGAAVADDFVTVSGTVSLFAQDSTLQYTVASSVVFGSGGVTAATTAANGTVTSLNLAVDDVDIGTVAGANQALQIIDAALTEINSQRADLGAIQNRFESVISNLANVSENSSAARSRIQDADFAQETANLARAQILQQAGISVLAQANAQPQNVLALLQ
jgi:flagellin